MSQYYKLPFSQSSCYYAKLGNTKNWLSFEINTRVPFYCPSIHSCNSDMVARTVKRDGVIQITAEEFEKAFTVAQTMQREAINHFKETENEQTNS